MTLIYAYDKLNARYSRFIPKEVDILDKYEYKIRSEEIKSLISTRRYADAVKIADSIDWKRVKSVTMLCTISDLYKINRRFEESKEILLMAYERYPNGRAIVYSLCELSIKMGEFVQAIEYYKEFVRVAPRDTGRYILQYKLYEAQDVSLEERIAVLEEFKKHDYRERWAYELAYLYHRVGLTTECIEEVDEMFLWFHDGKYVLKALELKALHSQLSSDQQEKLRQYKNEQTNGADSVAATFDEEKDELGRDEADDGSDSQEIKYPTKEMYETAKEQEAVQSAADAAYEAAEESKPVIAPNEDSVVSQQTMIYQPQSQAAEAAENPMETSHEVNYDTMNLQKALADSMKEIMAKGDNISFDENDGDIEPTEVFDQEEIKQKIAAPYTADGEIDKELFYDDEKTDFILPVPEAKKDVSVASVAEEEEYEDLLDEAPGAIIRPLPLRNSPESTSHYDDILSQDYDGQISLVVPEDKIIEKQITGQISIEDIMSKIKSDQQQKQMEKVKKRVADETSDMFADFDEKSRADIQIRIERAVADAIRKEKAGANADTTVHGGAIITPTTGAEPFVNSAKSALDDVLSGAETVEEEKPSDTDSNEEASKEEASKEETTEDTAKDTAAEENASTDNGNEGKDAEEIVSKDIEENDNTEKPEVDNASEGEEPDKDEAAKEEPADKESSEDNTKADDNNPDSDGKASQDAEGKSMDERVRAMTPEEKKLFGPYINHRKSRNQIINAIDTLSLSASVDNVIVTGDEGTGTVSLAKGLIRSVQLSDNNFSGKVAKITANSLNRKSVEDVVDKLSDGALIIQHAADMKQDTVKSLFDTLQNENKGIIVVLEDNKKDIDRLLKKHPKLKDTFNVRVDVEALDDETLVSYAKQYAYDKEHSIDNLGVLALHTRIEDMQTLEHEVTISEVKDIVDDAMYYADQKSAGHFFDVLFNKRYDEEDMIVLTEKDFMH